MSRAILGSGLKRYHLQKCLKGILFFSFKANNNNNNTNNTQTHTQIDTGTGQIQHLSLSAVYCSIGYKFDMKWVRFPRITS